MVATVTREEFESRVGVLEREVEGEKMVSRHILEQTRRNSDDLAAIKTRVDRVERKIDGLEQKVDNLERKVDRVEIKLDNLVRDLPGIVGDAVRDVLGKGGAKR